MTGKLIAQKLESRRSLRLIEQKDGNAVFWVFVTGRRPIQTFSPIGRDDIEETIQSMGLNRVQPDGSTERAINGSHIDTGWRA